MDLSVSTYLKNVSYNSIWMIVDYLTKIIYYKPIKIMIDVSSQAKVINTMVVCYHSIFKSIIIN